jgi:hypothetical protein
MFRKYLAVGTIVASAAFSSVANAAAVNLLANGSFESGLTGWTALGTHIAYAPAVVVTDGVTGCCFGEAVPADYISGGSPDAAGTHGVYFVDDVANQFLTQSVFLTAGSYEVGFDAYAPFNGFANAFDAEFTGTIAGVLLADFSVHDQDSPGEWFHYSGVANVLTDGIYDVSFNYITNGIPAADVVIDRAYIVASTQGGGTPVGIPEPASLALMGLGLIALAARPRRAK